MKKRIYEAKTGILKQKKFYEVLISIVIVSVVIGIIFVFFLKNNEKIMVDENLKEYFDTIKSSKSIDYSKSLLNSLLINNLYNIVIWLLGISIIGIPIILGILIFKSFTIGFSVTSIIMKYKFKGVLGAFLYVFPHQIINIIIYVLLSFYSISFSYRLFCSLFIKKNIQIKYGMKKYIKILLISILVTIINCLYEVFISTYIMKIFTIMLK